MSKQTENSSIPSPLQETNKISFVTSNKGKPLLCFGHHLFKCNKTTETKRYWVCIERQCGVFIHTNLNDEFLLVSGDHNHVAGPDTSEMRALQEKMKNRIINETTSITKIYDEEIATACPAESTAATFPTVVEYRMYPYDGILISVSVSPHFLLRFKHEQSSTKSDTGATNVLRVWNSDALPEDADARTIFADGFLFKAWERSRRCLRYC